MQTRVQPTSVRNLSVSSPIGRDRNHVQLLLRALANTIDELGAVDVHDITFDTETTATGATHNVTLYFSQAEHNQLRCNHRS